MCLVDGNVGSNALQRAGVVRRADAVVVRQFATVLRCVFVVAMVVVHLLATAVRKHAHTMFGARFATVVSHVETAAGYKKIDGQQGANGMKNRTFHNHRVQR